MDDGRAAAGIVLAAGRSVRFGRDKRLEVVAGEPMLLRAATLLRQAVPDTLVVLGPDDSAHAALLARHGIRTTHCPDASSGMGHSLAHAVARRDDASGWLIMPADLPYLRPDTVRAVLDAAGGHDLAAPFYRGRRGHPVWLSRRFRQELRALTGDEGARSILLAHGGAAPGPALDQDGGRGGLLRIEVQDPGCVLDIDTPRDLRGAG